MSKIYSRKRIKLPKVFISFRSNIPKKNKNKSKFIYIIIIIIIAIITSKVILDAMLPIFEKLCKNKASQVATIVSNNEATNVMRQHSYDEFFSIEKDNNGNITMIKSNVIPINEVISDVTVKIQEGLKEYEEEEIYISFGSITGINFLSGSGPRIKIKVISDGNIKTDLKSEFVAKGINQTLHRIYLQVDCDVSILTPFENINTEVSNQVLLAENIIVGNIPNTFYNLEGLNEGDALEVME